MGQTIREQFEMPSVVVSGRGGRTVSKWTASTEVELVAVFSVSSDPERRAAPTMEGVTIGGIPVAGHTVGTAWRPFRPTVVMEGQCLGVTLVNYHPTSLEVQVQCEVCREEGEEVSGVEKASPIELVKKVTEELVKLTKEVAEETLRQEEETEWEVTVLDSVAPSPGPGWFPFGFGVASTMRIAWRRRKPIKFGEYHDE